MLLHTDAIADRQRALTGEDGRPRIALAVGKIPVGVIALEFELKRAGAEFGFLNAKKICIH